MTHYTEDPGLKVGQRAVYRGNYGNAEPVLCTITAVEDDPRVGLRMYSCRITETPHEYYGFAAQFSKLN